MRLQNRVAIVAGADDGIDQATAFAAEGTDVCITYQTDADGAEETRRRIKAAGGRGRLIFVGSVAGHLPPPESASQSTAKADMGSLMRSLSREVAPDRIDVDAIAPGLIETPMTRKRLDDQEARAKSVENIPWGRAGEPGEFAAHAMLLVSDDAEYVTGPALVLGGSLTMNRGGA